MTCLSQLDVVILAGGLGTRIRPLFPDRPKVMIPINGRPFVDYLLDQIHSFGGRRVILALGHMASDVERYVENRRSEDMEIVTSPEPLPLGTGGGLRFTLPVIESDTVLVMNGDSFTSVDICAFLDFHGKHPASLSMVITYVPNVGRFGIVETENDGMVRSFVEKPQDSMTDGYVNAGLYLIDKDAISDISPDMEVSLERDVFPVFYKGGLYAYKGDFPLIDIGTPESYGLAESFFSEVTHAY